MKVLNKEFSVNKKTFQAITRLELEFDYRVIQDLDKYDKGIRDDLVKVLGEELIRVILEK